MHLWPSMRIRDSFKISYLKKLEWNLNRMNSEKKQRLQSNDQQQTLLVDDNNQRNDISETPSSKKSHFASGFVAVCGEILMVLSCCYCCYCCGGDCIMFSDLLRRSGFRQDMNLTPSQHDAIPLPNPQPNLYY